MPTETVYGLAADATNGTAVARIYAAKGRPSFNPLIVHVTDLEQARTIGVFSVAAERAARRWWPGPLTLVVPLRSGSAIASIASAGLSTIALRSPYHPAMRALIEATGKPLAAPSANASGTISPTSAQHVLSSLGGRIPLIVDGGRCEHGLESTIVAVTGDEVRLLRPGPVGFDAIIAETGLPVGQDRYLIEAPGQLESHYAPTKAVRLNAVQAHRGEWMIGFGAIEGDFSLSRTGDPVEAASNLFDALHRADASDARAIAVAPIPDDGIGQAINDRLRRAAIR